MADPVSVGYYDSGAGQGNPNQLDEITLVGGQGVNLTDLTAEALAALRILVIQNTNVRDGYPTELVNGGAALARAVANGLVVIIGDRRVTGASSAYSFLEGINLVQAVLGEDDLVPSQQIQLGPDGNRIASTPFGTVTNTSLDDQGRSSHGYATLDSLPDGALVLLTRDNPNHVTAFAVQFGLGWVIYTTVPFDFRNDADLANSGDPRTANMEAFVRNLLYFATTLLPFANGDTATATENTATVIDVLNNDTGGEVRVVAVDGQEIEVGETVTLASGSTVTLNANGTLTYTSGAASNYLNPGQTGQEIFTYTISDGDTHDDGQVTVTINGDFERIGPATPRADTLVGTIYDDYVDGLAGNDVITTGLGNDVIRGGLGSDKMTGGGGDDYYYVGEAGDQVIEALNGGNDTVESSLATYTLAANVEKLVLGEGARDGTGNTLNNQITGNGSANTLNGGAGNDMIDAGGGADIVIGGAGSDLLFGGAGADTFLYQTQADSGSGVGQLGRGSVPAPFSSDTILDFSVREGDRIDLRAIDANANTKAVNDDFVVVSQFTRVAGQMVIEAIGDVRGVIGGEAAPGGNHYRLFGDTNGDGISDFTLDIYSQSVLQVSDLSSILGIQSVNITQIPVPPGDRDHAPAGLDAGWFI